MISKFKELFNNKFYIFGSKDSKDYDILVSVDDVPQNVDEAHSVCQYFNNKISKILTDKPLNCNIGVIKDGKIVKLFKGTPDELNNVLFYTYDNHTQYYTNPISSPIERDISLKVVRFFRFIITFFSRTSLRPTIKSALRGNLKERLEALEKIDFLSMREFPGKKENPEDIYKVIAFQIGQVLSLIEGHEPESYTKYEISKNYPELSNMINRGNITDLDLSTLNKRIKDIIKWTRSNLNLEMVESVG